MRSCRRPIDEQLDLAKEMAIAYVLGSAGYAGRTSSLTKEETWQIHGVMWMVSAWQSEIAMRSIKFAIKHIGGQGRIEDTQIAEFISGVEPEMLAWCCLTRSKIEHMCSHG